MARVDAAFGLTSGACAERMSHVKKKEKKKKEKEEKKKKQERNKKRELELHGLLLWNNIPFGTLDLTNYDIYYLFPLFILPHAGPRK